MLWGYRLFTRFVGSLIEIQLLCMIVPSPVPDNVSLTVRPLHGRAGELVSASTGLAGLPD